MSVAVRPAVFDTDRLAVVELLARNLNPVYDAARFDWLYVKNPAGQGRLWVALDTGSGEIIGTAGAFPRLFSFPGNDAVCWVLGDFCISERYRTLGPAVSLQRLCLGLVGGDGPAFCYDFPSRTMLTVYQRLRITPMDQMRRLVKGFGVGWRVATLARRIGPGVERIFAASRGGRRAKPDLRLALHEGPFEHEFSCLAEVEAPGYGVCVKRTADYLNWRYRDNPTAQHEILTAREGGRLVGYAAFTTAGDAASLVDLFGCQDGEVLPALADATAELVRQRGCASLSVSVLSSHPWTAMFRALGFMPREACPVVLSGTPNPTSARLFLMHGDRDS